MPIQIKHSHSAPASLATAEESMLRHFLKHNIPTKKNLLRAQGALGASFVGDNRDGRELDPSIPMYKTILVPVRQNISESPSQHSEESPKVKRLSKLLARLKCKKTKTNP